MIEIPDEITRLNLLDEIKLSVTDVNLIKALEEIGNDFIKIRGTTDRDFNIYSRKEISPLDLIHGLINYYFLEPGRKIGYGFIRPNKKGGVDGIDISIDGNYKPHMKRLLENVSKESGLRFVEGCDKNG